MELCIKKSNHEVVFEVYLEIFSTLESLPHRQFVYSPHFGTFTAHSEIDPQHSKIRPIYNFHHFGSHILVQTFRTQSL